MRSSNSHDLLLKPDESLDDAIDVTPARRERASFSLSERATSSPSPAKLVFTFLPKEANASPAVFELDRAVVAMATIGRVNPLFAGPHADWLALIPFVGLAAFLYVTGRQGTNRG